MCEKSGSFFAFPNGNIMGGYFQNQAVVDRIIRIRIRLTVVERVPVAASVGIAHRLYHYYYTCQHRIRQSAERSWSGEPEPLTRKRSVMPIEENES